MAIKRKDFQKTAAVLNEFLMKLPAEGEYAETRDTLHLLLLHLQRLFKFLRQRYVRTDSESSELTIPLSRLSPMTPFQDTPDKFQCRWMDLEKGGGGTLTSRSFNESVRFNHSMNGTFDASVPPLLTAAKNGDNARMSFLLEQDAQCVNERDMFGRTALMYAVHFGHLDSIQVLLENNSDINARTGDDVTAVHWACHDCNDEALRILVGYGAELENQDYLGRAPIHWACAAKSIACLKILLEKNVNVNLRDFDGATPCMWACRMDNIEHFQMLSNVQMMSGEPDDELERDNNGWTWMHWAVRNTDPHECLKTLLTDDTCQLKDNEGRTVLHIAAEIGSLGAAKVILEIGGKQCLEQRDNFNRTPLILATLYAHGKLLNYLLEQGADVLSVDNDQCSALDYAKTYNRQYCLLIIGAYLSEQEKNGTLSNYGTAFGMDSLQIDGAVKGGIVHESMPVHPPKPPSEPKPTPRTPRGSTSPRKVKAANSSSDDFDNQQQNGNSGNRVSSDQSQQVASPPVPASPPSPANRAPSRRLTRKRTPDDEDDDNSVNNDISERPHQMQVEQRTVTSAGKKKRAYVKANQHATSSDEESGNRPSPPQQWPNPNGNNRSSNWQPQNNNNAVANYSDSLGAGGGADDIVSSDEMNVSDFEGGDERVPNPPTPPGGRRPVHAPPSPPDYPRHSAPHPSSHATNHPAVSRSPRSPPRARGRQPQQQQRIIPPPHDQSPPDGSPSDRDDFHNEEPIRKSSSYEESQPPPAHGLQPHLSRPQNSGDGFHGNLQPTDKPSSPLPLLRGSGGWDSKPKARGLGQLAPLHPPPDRAGPPPALLSPLGQPSQQAAVVHKKKKKRHVTPPGGGGGDNSGGSHPPAPLPPSLSQPQSVAYVQPLRAPHPHPIPAPASRRDARVSPREQQQQDGYRKAHSPRDRVSPGDSRSSGGRTQSPLDQQQHNALPQQKGGDEHDYAVDTPAPTPRSPSRTSSAAAPRSPPHPTHPQQPRPVARAKRTYYRRDGDNSNDNADDMDEDDDGGADGSSGDWKPKPAQTPSRRGGGHPPAAKQQPEQQRGRNAISGPAFEQNTALGQNGKVAARRGESLGPHRQQPAPWAQQQQSQQTRPPSAKGGKLTAQVGGASSHGNKRL